MKDNGYKIILIQSDHKVQKMDQMLIPVMTYIPFKRLIDFHFLFIQNKK
ncbi:MAG: hypothetical protein RLZZ417_1648 [Bacteroidota bacterium]|jgi:hypothetical protein